MSGMKTVKAWLCRIGWHAYAFAGLVSLVPSGALVRCRRCGKEKYESWI